jgi:hypothetical protein
VGEPGTAYSQWLQTKIRVPHFDKIALRLQEMRRGRRAACLITPKWSAATWGAEVRRLSKHRLQLGKASEVLRDEGTASAKERSDWTRWELEAHLVVPDG